MTKRKPAKNAKKAADTNSDGSKASIDDLTNASTLQRLFANHKAWELLEEEQKIELLSLVPSMFHPDTSVTPIPPLDAEFLHSTDWSGGVRLFAEDVQLGRYASKYRADAEKASRERAEGKVTVDYDAKRAAREG